MDFLRGQEAFLNLISSVEKDSVIPLLKWIQFSSGLCLVDKYLIVEMVLVVAAM